MPLPFGAADPGQWAVCGAAGPMITALDPLRADAATACAKLPCSSCGGVLGPWGYARARSVRGRHGNVRLRPPRVRCRDCKVTHVVLPARVLPRCSVTAEVVGQMLVVAAAAAAACGQGHRGIAARLGLPADTVRGWLRRARAHAERLRAVGSRAAVAYDVNFIWIVPRYEALADAVEALGRAAMAVRIRLGVDAVPPRVGPWELIVWLCRGDLLGPRARSG